MPWKRAIFRTALAALVLGCGAGMSTAASVDDFEGGLPAGNDGIVPIGFFTFAGDGAVTIGTTASPPAPVPGAAAGNQVLQMNVDTGSFAGMVHVFENATRDALAPRDWSAFDALTLWVYGSNTGAGLYIDVLDNRGGPSTYPFELWTSTFTDDFSGWKQLSFAFADLTRKDIGNGAPDDGLGLTAVHGWALGTLATGGARTYFVDDLRIASSVPEPGTLASLCAGLILMMGLARRRLH